MNIVCKFSSFLKINSNFNLAPSFIRLMFFLLIYGQNSMNLSFQFGVGPKISTFSPRLQF